MRTRSRTNQCFAFRFEFWKNGAVRRPLKLLIDPLVSWLMSGWLGVSAFHLSPPGQAAESAPPQASAPELTTKYRIDNWTIRDGLPQNTVLAIAQTPDSYLWLATFNGLARFDGVRFTVFNPLNTPALRSGRIITLDLDRHGWLWIGSEEGHLVRLAEGRFENASGRWGLPPDSGFNSLGTDPEGNLWVQATQGQAAFRFADKSFIADAKLDSISYAQVKDVASGGRGGVWLGNGSGWQPVSSRTFRDHVRADGLGSTTVIARSRDGDMWVLGERELRKIHSRTSRMLPPGQSFPGATSLAEDQFGNIFLGTWTQGLFVFPPAQDPKRIPLSTAGAMEPLRTSFIDSEGDLWLGSHVNGLYRVKLQLFRTLHRGDGLSTEVTKSVMEDFEGNVWIANENGLDLVTPDGRVVHRISEKGVWCVSRDISGDVWFGSWAGDVWRLREKSVLQCRSEDGSGATRVRALAADRRGGMWLGSSDGLWRLNGAKMARVPLPANFPTNEVCAIVEDSKGGLYLGLYGGGLLHRDGERWSHLGKAEGLSDERVISLYIDADDTVWVGTVHNGLSRFKDGKFVNLGLANSSIPSLVACILEDDLGHLWLGSVNGIHRVSRRELNEAADGLRQSIFVSHYNEGDGLGTSECAYGWQPTAWKGRDGQLWFATINGVSVVDPKSLPFNPRPPPVVIEEMLIDETAVTVEKADEDGGLRIEDGGTGARVSAPSSTIHPPSSLIVPPGHHRLEIRYTGLSFIAPEKVRFKYQLEGHDNNWIETGDRRVAYNRVPPGDYRFKVTACNNDGVWNETGAVLSVIVLPYFWQTRWFLASSFVLLAGTAGWVVRHLSLKRLQRKMEILEQQHALEKERTRISRDMHDDLGANLAQLALMSDLAGREVARPQVMSEQITKVSSLAREIMRNVDEIVWAVNPKNDSFDKFVAYVCQHADELLALANIRFRWDAPPDVPAIPLSAEFRHNLFLVIKEALNNLVKYSEATEAQMCLTVEAGLFSLTITDNGRGFDVGRVVPQGGGNGLENMRKRIEECGGQFVIESRPGAGTRLQLTVPMMSV
jgi:signal transduction histidine kinase/ligand-binding sensor domain-containing protein